MLFLFNLVLNRKLRVYVIFDKEDNLLRYTEIFENFLLEIFVRFDFKAEISEVFDRMVPAFGNSIFDFNIFWNLSLEIFTPLLPARIENFGIFV